MDAFIQQLPNCVNRDLIDKVRTVSNSHPCKKKFHKIKEKDFVFGHSLVGEKKLTVKLFLQAAMDFCMNMNTKANRRKLVRALFTVPRQRLVMGVFYLFLSELNVVVNL